MLHLDDPKDFPWEDLLVHRLETHWVTWNQSVPRLAVDSLSAVEMSWASRSE